MEMRLTSSPTVTMFKVGQVLQERYQLRQPLRTQSNRQTWLARDRHPPHQTVVVKFLAFGRGMGWDQMKLFEREVKVLQQLNHPQIPQYLDSFHLTEPESWLGLIETYIPGKDLQRLLEEGYPFSESKISNLATQVLKILIYLHEQTPPILHRDIKPSNLILTPNHQVFLVDFGAVQNRWSSTTSSFTSGSFTVVGTYGYTPLEQFGGQAVPASDLYGLGATLIHLLTGLTPAELTQPDLRIQFCDRIPLTPHLTTWLKKMTAPALIDRFPSAQAALLQLNASPTVPIADVHNNPLRLQIDSDPEHLQVRVHPIWSRPLLQLQDLAGMTLLTLLGPVTLILLALLPIGILYTRQALLSGDIGGISIGILLLCLGGIPWFTGLNWLKQNLTSTLIESFDHRFIVKYQLFGCTYWQQAHSSREIAHIYAISLTPEAQTVMVNCQDQTAFALASNLNLQDSQTLTQTLQQWVEGDG